MARLTPALFHFLNELRDNNSGEWFQANKPRFEAEVRGPLLAFIQAFAEPLDGLNRHFLADPRLQGGSMFRINRDIRFSLDKSPYKTNVGAQFRHRDCTKDVHAPAFYLHLEPGRCLAGAGMWHPDPPTLKTIREYMLAHPRAWKALAGLGVTGDTVTRVPLGLAQDHPLAEGLRLKDYYTVTPLTQAQVCAPDFLATFTESCRASLPLMKFLSQALALPW